MSSCEIARLFAPRTLADYQALPRPERELLLAVYHLTRGLPWDGGQAALAEALRSSVRSVQRKLAGLNSRGFAVERRGGDGQPATIFLHPAVAACAVAERVAPSRPRYARRPPPAPTGFAVAPGSLVARCAAVRRSDGRPFLSAYALLGLMDDHEIDRCAYAAERGAPIAQDPDVDGLLRDLFAARERRRRVAEADRFAIAFLDHGRRLERGEREERPAA